ncbi:MAG: diguanylate cyclase domain-containing protein [Burkholderiaceae bacterium]
MKHVAYSRQKYNERFIQTVTDNLPGLLAYWDADLRCQFANKRYIEWFNKKPEDMIGMRLQDLLGTELFAKNEPYIRKALGGEPQNFERTLTKASGEVRHTWATYIPDVDEDGQIAGIFILVTDVTTLMQAKEELRISATAFESQEAMMITDANRVILRVNRAFTELTGYDAEEVVGQTPQVLMSGRHDADFYAAMWQSIEATGLWQGEIWDRRKNGEIFPGWMTISAVKDAHGMVTHYVAAQSDMTSRKIAEEEIKRLAFYDPLTGLPNRRLMLDRLKQSMATSARTNKEGALLFIDLDNFKTLNDTFGHDMGDLLLQQVAERISSHARECDTVARIGGDEFVVVLDSLSENIERAATQAEEVCKKILGALNQPYDLPGNKHFCTPSIGVTLFKDQKNDIAELLKQADIAMYQAKAEGRNTIRFFKSYC